MNIDSINNKFLSLQELVSNDTHVLVIEERKLDQNFPEGSFTIPRYKNLSIKKVTLIKEGY